MSAILLLWLMPGAHGLEMTSLYSVQVPLEQGEADEHTTAYRKALTEVLVRVIGSTAEAESDEIALLFPNPSQFVSQYRPGQDDTLIVTMDGKAIERVLRQSGKNVWGTDRPLTLVWLAVDWGMGEREIVGADDQDPLVAAPRPVDRNKILRERVQEVAMRRGVPVVFPIMDTEDLENVGFGDIWGGFDEQLIEASARYEATSVLVGRIRPDSLQPHRWTWHLDGQRLDWQGEPEDAIELLADSLAVRDGIRGDERPETIRLTISGIDSVISYGRVQRYLENLRVIDRLMVKTVSANRVVYEVDVQGDVQRLDKALASSSILVPVEPSYAVDTGSAGSFGQGLQLPDEPHSLNYLLRPDRSN
jgi:uncharacterized protein